MAQKQTKKAEQGKEPLKCTWKNCQKLQCEDGEFCEAHSDVRYCYLCDSILVKKYCENTSCAEYKRDNK